MAKMMMCPCGQRLEGRTDDEFVSVVDTHLRDSHGGRSYPAEAILSMATSVPDETVAD
ncbi:DUF1059 domain-containing protein [Aeromicrobium sp. SMF47]|uniref:DUF1059 domain-containing protein n=1 Tax=Aeromicrobium yanjiei TaxID=2662028 RepID=A0A5Q2MG61_9ACTN|nr:MULTISPECIES: DUF1059 domain-containing protein [Aeromicrobium]MRJ76708.1 DUF1059 domain-containing protein [Aeromicrobium yanjiei]MRK01052.1 DUF1059 domain-containing protein [Aeromicrobium sp. S22]QGG42144.1 DUF1059 domain-containing protein [Aeromicrobium yanjiei]